MFSRSSVWDPWGEHRGLCLLCDLQCISCWHFELIFVYLVLKRIFADSGSEPFPPFLGLCDSFSVTMPVGSCMHGWFQLAVLPWIPPCYAWEGTSSQAHLLAMSSMSPTDDGTAIVLGQIRATWRSSRLQGKGCTFNSQLSWGPPPPPALQSSALPTEVTLPHTM